MSRFHRIVSLQTLNDRFGLRRRQITRRNSARDLRLDTLERRDMLTTTPFAAESMFELPASDSGVNIAELAVESNGNLIAYGTFYGTVDFDPGSGVTNLNSSGSDFFVAKYDATGSLINAVDLSDGNANYGIDLAVDSDGSVYLTGDYSNTLTLLGGIDLPDAGRGAGFVAKLDSALQAVQWESHSSGDGTFYIRNVAVDALGSHVYVSGTAFASGSFGDANYPITGQSSVILAQIDPQNGQIQWLKDYGGYYVGSALAVDAGDPDAIFLVHPREARRLDSAGNILWTKTIDDGIHEDKISVNAVEAYAGDLFIAGTMFEDIMLGGTSLTVEGGEDIWVASMDGTSGDYNWASRAGGPLNDRLNAMTVDHAGSVIISGRFEDVAVFGNDTLVARTVNDAYVSQMDAADGAFVQSWRYGRAFAEVVTASPGYLYVAGRHNTANIDFPSGDQPQASSGQLQHVLRFVTAADATVPRINGFQANPRPAELDAPLTLDVIGMHDPDNRVNSVAFYHDIDANRRLDSSIDVLVGTDTDGTDGWKVDIAPSALPLGDVFFLAQAAYDGSETSLEVSEEVFLRNPSTTYVSSNVGLQIRDLKTVTSTLNVADSFAIGDVDVTLNITHTNNEDLDVLLIHPDGTRIELFTDVGFYLSDNFIDTTLDDQAEDAISDVSWKRAPYTGRYRPEGLLSTLNGKHSAGMWKLEITDDSRHDQGTLNAWSLNLAPETLPPATFSIGDFTITEGDSGSKVAPFTVTRSGDVSSAVSVDVATTDGTAQAGMDYDAMTTTVTFAAGVTSMTVNVPVLGDLELEGDETFSVNLSNPVGGVISDGQGIGTILDDDSPIVANVMFVYDIRFDSKRGGKDHRAVFEIRADSDSDGQGTSNDNPLAGVEITVAFAGMTFTGTTDANGVFRTPWVQNTPAGSHANVVDLALADYDWDPLLDLKDDDVI